MKNLLIVLSSVALVFAGCTSASSPCPGLTEVTGPYTISGHLLFKSPITIPADAKVICYWNKMNPATTDFNSSHVFGEGSLNMADSSFTITFRGLPPNLLSFTQGCKSVKLSGPGYVLLVADRKPGNWFDTVRVLGAIDHSAMIYCISNTTLHSWHNNFLQGYGIGSGSSSPSDSLTRISNTGLTLSVDSEYTDYTFPHDWMSGATPTSPSSQIVIP